MNGFESISLNMCISCIEETEKLNEWCRDNPDKKVIDFKITQNQSGYPNRVIIFYEYGDTATDDSYENYIANTKSELDGMFDPLYDYLGSYPTAINIDEDSMYLGTSTNSVIIKDKE